MFGDKNATDDMKYFSDSETKLISKLIYWLKFEKKNQWIDNNWKMRVWFLLLV